MTSQSPTHVGLDTPPRSVVWALAVGAIGLFVLFAVRQVPVSITGQSDFPNYYFAGEGLLSGRPVYGDVAARVEEVFGVDYEVYPADPPATVALLSPLALLPYRAAWLALATLSVGILSFVVYRVARDVGLAGEWAVIATALALISTNFRFLIARNHMESLLLLAGYLGWRALRARRETSAGTWWGVAAALKLFPALWIVGLVAARRWRAVRVGVAIAVTATLAGVALVGPVESWRFATEVVPRSERWYGTLGNYSVLSFGTALVDEWFGWLLVGAAAIVLLPFYLRRPGGSARVWAAGTALGLLLSPLAWHNYLILTFPALLMVAGRLRFRATREVVAYVGLVGGLAFWGPVVVAGRLPTVLLSFVPTYALLALFIVSMRVLPEEGAEVWASRSATRSPTSN